MAGFEEQLEKILSSPESLEQVMKIAKSLRSDGLSGSTPPAGETPPPQPPPPPPQPAPLPVPAAAAEPETTDNVLGAIKNLNLNPQMLSAAAAALGGSNSDSVRLLYALKPFLSGERREKVDGAVTALKLAKAAKELFRK